MRVWSDSCIASHTERNLAAPHSRTLVPWWSVWSQVHGKQWCVSTITKVCGPCKHHSQVLCAISGHYNNKRKRKNNFILNVFTKPSTPLPIINFVSFGGMGGLGEGQCSGKTPGSVLRDWHGILGIESGFAACKANVLPPYCRSGSLHFLMVPSGFKSWRMTKTNHRKVNR